MICVQVDCFIPNSRGH